MADDYPDNITTTGFIPYNGPAVTANIETIGDVDWFGFNDDFPNRFVITDAQFEFVRIQVVREDGVVLASYYGPSVGAYLDFTPPPEEFPGANYFFVAVTGYASGDVPTTGAYTLSATAVNDDHPDTHTGQTTGVIIDGPEATGVINFHGDWDTFHINDMTGEQVRIDVTAAEFAYVIIRALGETGNVVASYSGLIDGATFVAPANARYVTIIGFDAAGNYTTGAYSFTMSSIPDDHGDTLATATPITLGETVNGVFEPGGDADWFAISLTAGQPVLFTLPDTVGDLRFYLANGNETEADIPAVRQNGQLTAGFVADATGVYYVRVTGVSGPYTLGSAISPYNPHDPANFPSVPANGYLTGYLSDNTDVAWYRVDLAAGETVSIQYNYQNINITFYDTQGNEVVPAQGPTGRYITASEATTYYIALTSPGGVYNLMSVVGADDFADGLNAYGGSIEPIGVLTPDGPAVTFSPNHSGDVDFFAISLAEGQSIEIIAPWWLGVGTNTGGILFYDSAGNPVEADFFRVLTGSMMGDTQSAGMTATTAGTYYVALASDGPTSFTFPVQAVTLTSLHPMDVSTFEVLTDGEYVPSGAGNGWFAVNLQAGQTFALDGEGGLYDVYGNQIYGQAVTDWTQDWFNYYTVATTGTYYFHVSPGENGGPNDFTAQIFFDDAADWAPVSPTPTPETYPVLDANGDQFNGRIEVFEDEDYFAFTLATGQAVRIRVEFTDLHDMSEAVVVVGPDGQTYTGQLESVDGSEILFTAPAAGTYYVRVDGLYRYIGDYTITLTPAAPSDAYTGEPSIMPAAPARPAVTPIATTVTSLNGGTYTVSAGTILYGENLDNDTYWAPYGSPVIYASIVPGFSSTLDNAGFLYSYADEWVGFGVTTVNADHLINSGTIVAENAFEYRGPGTLSQSAIAVSVHGLFPNELSLQNSGQIIALATQSNATAVASSSDPLLHNSGLIAAYATWSPNDPTQSGGAYAINFGNGGTVINQVGGQIIAQGDSYAAAVITSDWGLSVTNYGLIEAQTQGAHAVSRAISAAPTSTTSTTGGVVYNYGAIRADQAVYGNLNVNNYAGGIIDGDIILFTVPNGINTSTNTITNQGTINGHIAMGDGDDSFDNTGGQMNGSVDLSYGRDTYVGGDGVDAVVGGHGDDNISGAGGQDLLLGSYGDDAIVGGAGNDGMYGEIGDDSIVTAGGDMVSGGAGDDRIETSDYTFASISGDAGFDTWVLPSGARTLDLALVIASGRISGIEAIQLAGSQTLVVHPADVAAITGAAALYISGAATNAVYLSGAWTVGVQIVRDGVTYTTFTSGGSTVYVQAGVSTTVGLAPPVGTGLDAVADGPAALTPGAIIGASLSPDIINDGHRIIDQFVVGAGEVWESPYGYPVFAAAYLIGPTLTNYGSILSHGSTHPHVITFGGLGALGSATGISALHISAFENHGSIVATAILDGPATGFVGTAFNGTINGPTGIIHAFAENGLAIAYDGFDGSAGWGYWAVQNQGDIYAFSANGFAIGLSEFNGSYILNDGVIEANGGDGAIAVDLSNAGSGVWNRGQIIAYAPLTSTLVSVGIFSDGYTQIVNDGLIAAETAILMRSRYQEDVTITNTGTIIGDIEHTQPSSIALGAATINNSGDIFGNIYLFESLDPNSITNTGYIEGAIFFGSGADTYQGSGGQIVGAVFAGDGADNLQGGAFADVFFGEGGNDTMSGGGGNDLLDGGAGADAMSGGAGDDAFVVDDAGDAVTELANQGDDLVQAAITYTLGGNLERLTLTGLAAINGTGNALNNMIIGNSAANVLSGNGGNDTLNAGDGADTLYGGDGNDTLDGGAGADAMVGNFGDDTYYVDNAGDTVSEGNSAGGTDHVFASVSFNLGPTGYAENLTLTGAATLNGAGNNLANIITGNAAANLLSGAGGNDVLSGGGGDDTLDGGAGADAMSGGDGNDVYIVDNAGDTTLEDAVSGGADTVRASVTRVLGANLEHLELTGAAAINGYGNALDNTISGNGAANALFGGDGNDVLDGGAGADAMTGNFGNDTYYVDNAADVVSEGNIAGGVDTVFASVSFNLGPTGYADHLTLTGSAVEGRGNALANTLTGNAAANVLWGNGGDDTLIAGDGADSLYGGDGADSLDGGAGADTMIGNFGNDVYYVDNAGDVVSEGSSAGGTDTVFASVTFHLGPTGFADHLTLTGASAINATGNSLANTLTGNSAANVLIGNAGNDVLNAGDGADTLYGGDGADMLDGGTGADAMIGNLGDDAYHVDNAGDTVSEGSNVGGTDIVFASVSFNLAPTGFVENLTLTGSNAINATGNNLANTLTGNGAANTLTGAGGADSFVFASALGGGNVDAIADFSVADDTIVLSSSVFTGLGAGALDTGAFVIGAAAADADDRIVYDSTTGHLFFDADGAGGADQILFATLTAGLALTNADFIVSGP